MLQKTFALLHRSLRTDVRVLRTHFFRAALLGLILLTLYLQSSAWAASPGLRLFSWLVHWNFWFIAAAGGLYFSSAITEEKEEQTLGLLRLAGISPLTLLLGKWAPRLIGGLLLVAIQFPFTLLSITLGGVLIHQVASAYCTLAAHLVLCGSIGLFASVACSRSGTASILAFALMVGLYLCSYPIDEAVFILDRASLVPVGWIESNGGYPTPQTFADARLEQIMVTGFAGAAVGFQVVANLAIAAVFGGLSWLLFNRLTRNETAALTVSNKWVTQFTRLGRRSSRRAWSTPLIWKDFYQIAGGGWTILKFIAFPPAIAIIALMLSGASILSRSMQDFGMLIMGIMICVFVLEAAVMAARLYREEVQSHTWPLLAVLPRSIVDLSYGKLGGAVLGLAPCAFYFLLGALMAGQETGNIVDFFLQDADALLGLAYFVLQFVLFWHLAALLSIVWRWAAWPVAVFFAGAFVIAGNLVLVACLTTAKGPAPQEALLVFLCFIASALVFACHLLIGVTLERLAGE